jgi:hypothetical protein
VSADPLALIDKHRGLIARAIEAVDTRKSWSPFKDSPSTKIHGAEKPIAGKAAFEARLGQRFELGQPGITHWVGEEVSPYTQEPLGILYPVSDAHALIAAAGAAMPAWVKADPELRMSLCAEMAMRLYDRNFEMAQAVMHVAGQSYTQAFSGSGPNALDRGIEALAYAAKAIRSVAPRAAYHRDFAGEPVALEKTYTLQPRGIGLVICCASFPTWKRLSGDVRKPGHGQSGDRQNRIRSRFCRWRLSSRPAVSCSANTAFDPKPRDACR